MKENTIAISILIAARNEEDNLPNCLDKILEIDFPKDQLEVLVGDDNSSDGTFSILKSYEEKFSQIRAFLISSSINGLRGKANVLAQIAEKASGDYFFMTDADVLVNRNWIKSTLPNFSDSVDMIGGITGVVENGLFSKYQNFEWIYSYASRHIVSQREHRFFAAMGNNMAMKSTVYRKIGGYAKIPFSVAEDYDLFKHAIDNGFRAKSILNEDILALTYPISNFRDFLAQRRRWLTSVLRIPPEYVIGHIIHFGLLPIILLVSYFVDLRIGLLLFGVKYLVDILILKYAFKKLNRAIDFFMFLFPPVSILMQFIFLITQVNHKPIEWKERKYSIR